VQGQQNTKPQAREDKMNNFSQCHHQLKSDYLVLLTFVSVCNIVDPHKNIQLLTIVRKKDSLFRHSIFKRTILSDKNDFAATERIEYNLLLLDVIILNE
jgi:hypothetical protein